MAPATAQKLRTSTETESLQLVKSCTRISISVLTYLREIFPEDAYEERNMGGKLNVKVLKEGRCPEADQLVEILERGVFDALDKKYLRTLVLGVSLNRKNPDNLVEAYVFRFSYPSSTPHLNIQRKVMGSDQIIDAKLQFKSKDELKTATANTLRKMILLTQNLDPLPTEGSRILSFKIDYYDDIVPPDYEPPMFRAPENEDEERFSYEEEPTRLRLTELETGHVNVTSRLRISKNQFMVDGEPPEDHMLVDNLETDLERLSQVTAETERPPKPATPARLALAGNSQMEIERSGGPLVRATDEITKPAEERMKDLHPEPSQPAVLAAAGRQSAASDDTQSLIAHLEGKNAAADDIYSSVKKRDRRSKKADSQAAPAVLETPTKTGGLPPLPEQTPKAAERKDKSRSGKKQEVKAVEETLAGLNLNGQPKAADKGQATAGSNHSDDSLTPDQIDCLCGYPMTDGSLIECDSCNKYSHLPCAGFLNENDPRVPTKFKCFACRKDEPLDAMVMKDNALIRRHALNRMHVQLFSFRLCRSLHVIRTENLTTVAAVTKRICGKDNRDVGRFVFRRLRDEGFMTASWTKTGSVASHQLVPIEQTKEQYEAYFEPERVWVFEKDSMVPNPSSIVPHLTEGPITDRIATSEDESQTQPLQRVSAGTAPIRETLPPSAGPSRKRGLGDVDADGDAAMEEDTAGMRAVLVANLLRPSQDLSEYSQFYQDDGPARKRRKVSVAVTRIQVDAPEVEDE
ncbi:HORMA domain-containing protein [Hyaloraphidium curvatum]|nr:HORMA domain-containing protein [Hyaloraphidium curvatum]